MFTETAAAGFLLGQLDMLSKTPQLELQGLLDQTIQNAGTIKFDMKPVTFDWDTSLPATIGTSFYATVMLMHAPAYASTARANVLV